MRALLASRPPEVLHDSWNDFKKITRRKLRGTWHCCSSGVGDKGHGTRRQDVRADAAMCRGKAVENLFGLMPTDKTGTHAISFVFF